MNKTDALVKLGLEPGASREQITEAYNARKVQVEQKQQAAPTDALKQKLRQACAQLDEAYQVLLSTEEKGATKTSHADGPHTTPLTQTKLADLPGMGPAGAEQQLLQPGQVLAGRYKVEAQIGAGGMGAVYRAVDSNTGEPLALKVLLPSLTQNERARERFLNEARLSQKLSHPNIVNVYDVQHEGSLYFLTMELLEGQDLRQVMENRTLARQHFTLTELQQLASQLCAGLEYAHKYTVHRDIKPENIWLCEDGTYKLMDFGIAQLQSTSQRTQTGAAMGTAYYMAPEQLKGQKDIDGRADLYALGVLLYEMASGDVPAGVIKPLRERCPHLPKSFCLAVMQCLQSDPADRFPTAEALNERLASGKGGGVSLPLKPIGIAAGVLLLVGAIGFAATSGGLSQVWESIKPVSKEEIAQQKANIAQIEGQIRTLKQRLDNARRQLNSDVRDAERNNDSDYQQLAHWQTLTDNALFNGNTLTELEGQLAMAQSLLREDAFEPAHNTMNEVLNGYQILWEEFTAAEGLYSAESEATNAQKQWGDYYSKFTGVGEPEAAKNANDNFQQAGTEQLSGQFKSALALWQKAQNKYQQASNALQEFEQAFNKMEETQENWINLAKQYSLTDSNAEKAEQTLEQTEALAIAGELAQSTELAKQATEQWQSAIKATAGEVAAQDKANAEKKAAKVEPFIGRLVAIPAGRFQMGSNDGDSNERPVHSVSVPAFNMMEHEVTFAQWDACVSAGGCSHRPDDEGWGRGNRPVMNVSYNDITQQFIPWLNQQTGLTFRLPSEAEWEYAARAGSTTKYSWGNSISCPKARYGRRFGGECSDSLDGTVPVKSFAPNAYGLYDMHGNVWEWTQDCWNSSYSGAPTNGSAWQSGSCSSRVLRGGSWLLTPERLRSADRYFSSASVRFNSYGFRLVQAPQRSGG